MPTNYFFLTDKFLTSEDYVIILVIMGYCSSLVLKIPFILNDIQFSLLGVPTLI